MQPTYALSDLKGGQTLHAGSKGPVVTLALLHRFRTIESVDPYVRDRLSVITEKMDACVEVRGFRCEQPYCPKCEVHGAIRRSRRLLAVVHAARRAGRLVSMVTLTAPCDDMAEGIGTIIGEFARLRRRVWWRVEVVGGEGQVEHEPTGLLTPKWNVHLHVLVWSRRPLDARRLLREWRTMMSDVDRPGSADVEIAPGGRAAHDFLCKGSEYVHKRRLKMWLGYTDAHLEELVVALRWRRRLVRFGA